MNGTIIIQKAQERVKLVGRSSYPRRTERGSTRSSAHHTHSQQDVIEPKADYPGFYPFFCRSFCVDVIEWLNAFQTPAIKSNC
jgi:hypothetical protein